MIRAPTTSLGSSEPDLYQPSLPLFLTSVDSTISVLKLPFNNSTHTAVALCLPAWPPLHTHSNARKPIPFISLLHSSHHTPGLYPFIRLSSFLLSFRNIATPYYLPWNQHFQISIKTNAFNPL
jgi:hypothetical protein